MQQLFVPAAGIFTNIAAGQLDPTLLVPCTFIWRNPFPLAT